MFGKIVRWIVLLGMFALLTWNVTACQNEKLTPFVQSPDDNKEDDDRSGNRTDPDDQE